MDIKSELKSCISERLESVASPIFMKKALVAIEEAPDEREALTAAADKVGKMVSLFINKELGKEIYKKLTEKIEEEIP